MPFNDLFVLDLKNELREQSYILDDENDTCLDVSGITRNPSKLEM
jgi:hypothetical protein